MAVIVASSRYRRFKKWRHPMRKIVPLGIAAMLVLVTVGTWAAGTSSSQNQDGLSTSRINTFELTTNAKELPTEHHDAI
jgi:hypothetical protein